MPSLFERKPEYWARDLADRVFEEAVKAELDLLGWPYTDNTAAHERADLYFTRQVRGRAVRAALELKEKRQRYRPRWAELAGVPEAELLALDEVAARKLLAVSPRAFVLFHDATRADRPYVLFTIVDLLCLPKVRVQRGINLHSPRMKAKWLLDARHGRGFGGLREAMSALANYLDRGLGDDLRRVGPHGPFAGESVETL
ncbi:MAG: hypothetical protein BWY52_02330 [Chloroflexi bacterium ADurb.Bin325]|nr:MAG: hypothetical protein BWY52_02330 [Chloroflexi bacterium ADurb.Bin325]